MILSERVIENNVIRNRALLGYQDSVYIRRCRAGRGFGIVDVMLLPLRGPHRVVLIEAKRSISPDVSSKVIGQLLLYYAGALQFGSIGIRHMKNFATNHTERARNTKPKLLKTLSGGITPPDAAWMEMQKGRKLQPHQVGLYIALDALPGKGLKSTLSLLESQHGLRIGVVSVLGYNDLELWEPV
jgi:hypothetical protein